MLYYSLREYNKGILRPWVGRPIIIVNVYLSNADDDLLVPCHGPRYGRRNHNSLRAVPVDGLQPQDLNEMLLIHCPIGV